MRYARARVYMHTPSGATSVCPRVQRGHANIVLKRNRASELHGGARGKAREASKSKSERVTVGDPAAGCRQHSYNTTRPARPTHRAQYTAYIPTRARTHTHTRRATRTVLDCEASPPLGATDTTTRTNTDGFVRIDYAHWALSNLNHKVRKKEYYHERYIETPLSQYTALSWVLRWYTCDTKYFYRRLRHSFSLVFFSMKRAVSHILWILKIRDRNEI